jgi:short-subunit dehydrogenase
VSLPDPSARSTALVTGASSGIGAAIARALAARGHGVTLVARREQRCLDLARELSGANESRAEVIGCDLADPAGRERLAGEIEGLGLEVDVLVNNAGFGSYGEFVHENRERQVEMVRVNVEAVVDLEARYLPGMVERGGGAVINVASTAAFQPIPGSATYAATKAFVLSHGDALHAELDGTGVTVTSVCPGPVRTEFTEVAGMAGAEERTPGAVWMSAADVAEQALGAAEKGRRVVVPGLMNQAGALMGQHSPRMLALPLMKRVWRRVR